MEIDDDRKDELFVEKMFPAVSIDISGSTELRSSTD